MPFQKAVLACWLGVVPGLALDLKNAAVVPAANLSPQERKAVAMLVDEVEKRTRLRLPVAASKPASGPAIVIRRDSGPAEGYQLRVSSGEVLVSGNDARGVLFGVGGLLRQLVMEKDSLDVADNLSIATAPKYPLRGHQLGYRPKVNTYDGWTVAMYEQYIRDLAVFGANAIELIPPRSDDADDSPHFLLPKIRMLEEVSRLCAEYGIEFWLWYPAMDRDYSDPKTVEFALKEWGDVFRRLPRIDAIFVPGGDPGHTQPKYMMPLLEKAVAVLHQTHPKAQMWMAPQGFDAAWMDEWYGIMEEEPAWLSGVVFGPQVRVSLPELRARVPKRYPIRHYPDITHSTQDQYPVPDWDLAYAITEGREIINPRPLDQARIFRLFAPYTIGFLTYSEGSNDDVNKAIWSALGWNPETPVIEILRDFGRYFIAEKFRDSFAQGLLALERNWRGPLAANPDVHTTLQMFQGMERAASPQVKLNWRFQQALYRAYYDAYDRSRLLYETALEEQAFSQLRDARRQGSLVAMNSAEQTLNRAVTDPISQDLRGRTHELAEALYQSIRMQLSVDRYQAIAVGRGANLDLIDMPFNNRVWMEKRFTEIRQIAAEADRLKAIDEIINWTNPGPGGFYDDLGNLTRQPHLVRGPGFENDPAFLKSSLVGFGLRDRGRIQNPSGSGAGTYLEYPRSWWDHAETLYDTPLQMHYTGLDPKARYKVRVVYAGESARPKIRLSAGQGVEIHPLMTRPTPYKPMEFDLPPSVTANGELDLQWSGESGLGGAGRGVQVAEVWIVKQ